jgi:predicted dehydrogenase
MKTIGIGMIGTGFARKVQIPAFQQCAGARIVSVASGNIDNAISTGTDFGIPHRTGDWHETVAHPDVDLICITTPPRVHHEMTLFAIQNGKHVLCEKPMAMNTAEAEDMARAAKGSSLLVLIDHELRFQPGRLRAFEMLREGAIGKVRHAKAIFRAPHRGDPSLPWNWWSDVNEGGGALGAIASHIIDSFHWLLGSTISAVSCQLQTHVKERKAPDGVLKAVTSDDEANMLLRFQDGDLTSDATGLVSVSMCEFPHYENTVELFGEKGAMRIDHNGMIDLTSANGERWDRLDVPLPGTAPGLPDTGFARGFVEFAPRIVSAVASGEVSTPYAATFDDGVGIQRVLDAARRSDETGRTVDI